MCGPCSTYGGEEKCIQCVNAGFMYGKVTERGHLEDPNKHGSIIFLSIIKKWDVGVDWIDMAQDGDRWLALVNVVMNLWVP